MFENSSEELAYHKLLILYILEKINLDLTNSQITQVILETGMINYFSLQLILSDLMESKLLKIYKKNNVEYYAITQKGFETLECLFERIPEDIVKKVENYIANNGDSLLTETQIKSSYVKQSETEYIVNLRVIENQSNLIDLNLNVSSDKQAKLICDNWKNNASEMYSQVIQLLIRDKKESTNT